MKRVAALLLLIPVLLIVLIGCDSRQDDGQALAVRNTVTEYNAALIRAFVQMDMNELNQVSTEDQAFTEFYLMAALGESRVVMHSSLISIEFGEVIFSEDGKASVTTTEVWDYDHVSLDTSETVRTERGVVYHLQYDLVLQDGRWLVDKVTSLDEPAESQETTP